MTRYFSTLALALWAFGTTGVESQPASARPSTPREPIAAILEAFRSHSLVALGEGRHGNEQGHAFRLALIRDPRFSALVNDIVVEFGSASHQAVMDRFIRGDQVGDEALRLAWRDTTQPHTIWDRVIYEEFFRAVRAVNVSLPRDRQLRVLLGDPPLDWTRVKNEADYGQLVSENRNRHPVELITREVLAKKRRALIIYGDMHFVRRHALYDYDSSPALDGNSIVTLLERRAPRQMVFTVWTNTTANLEEVQSDVASWPKPSLTMLRDTVLGAADFAFYNPTEAARYRFNDGKPDFEKPLVRDQWRSLAMQDQFDAVLYLVPVSSITIAPLSPTLCSDAAYMAMRAKRSATVGWAQTDFDRLKAFCADRPLK